MVGQKQKGGLSERRGGGWRSLGAAGAGIARRALGRKGRAFAAFVTDWPSIVGEETAAHCLPLSLRFPEHDSRRDAVLTLKVDSGAWAAELSHGKRLLLERINGYFGYSAVAEVRFKSGPLPRHDEPPPEPAPQRPLTAAEEARLAAMLEKVETPELRRSLERLGRRLLARG